jgi:3-oxoacyl-[acyl-carrier protein] reductase
MNLKEAKVIVTGGSLGIGKATARSLVQEGARVLITGRDEGRLIQAAEETGAEYLVADVSNPDDASHTVKTALQVLGGLNVLINNAGIGSRREPIAEVTLADFQRVYAVNVFGAAIMTREAAKVFQAQNYGNIINVASTAASRGYAGGTVYASSKFALRGMNMCWQAELRKYNIRVILINPSEVTTAFGSKDRIEREEQSNRLRSAEVAHAIRGTLMMDDRGFIPELNIFATNPW